MLSKTRLVRLHALYRKGYSLGDLSEIFGLPWFPIWSGFHRHGLRLRDKGGSRKRETLHFAAVHVPRMLSEKEVERLRLEFLKLPIRGLGVRGYGELQINAIWSDYVRSGEQLAAVARRWHRSTGAIAQLMERRGLRTVDPERRARVMARQRVEGTGCFARMRRASPKEIAAYIDSATKIRIPPALRWEFRTWPMAKRADFIRRIRARLRSPKARPETPFSRNVQPFDYATPAARAIKDRLNAGLSSREAICKTDIGSQGVIYRGELWFWVQRTGYCKRGVWTPENGRPLLHRVIWEEHHGRKVPPEHVVRFRDGNDNNLLPGNLMLATRNDLARENQAAGLFRNSREITALLLKRAQGKERHGHIDTVQALKAA